MNPLVPLSCRMQNHRRDRDLFTRSLPSFLDRIPPAGGEDRFCLKSLGWPLTRRDLYCVESQFAFESVREARSVSTE